MATILLVEDDDLVRDMLKQVLERSHHRVITAPDGDAATELLKTNKPDIMDMLCKVVQVLFYSLRCWCCFWALWQC